MHTVLRTGEGGVKTTIKQIFYYGIILSEDRAITSKTLVWGARLGLWLAPPLPPSPKILTILRVCLLKEDL